MNYISEHARERFNERYNVDLPPIEYLLNNGTKQVVINRKGHIVNNKNRGIYRCVYNNQILEYVLSKQRNGDNVICTFNTPPLSMDAKCLSYKESEY